ncbi:hypothetical protein ACFRIC_08575 [Streptomyces sp. NPDC056738]|uniref:hypothetical protein n=1 Tax=Streptomyces sp. NPDC056738 TaxID=3345933 RepID=UPI0036C077BE
MSANRETNHDMAATDADISFLLAEAADGVDIGTAPYQAVLRGGRRRRARRWATAAAVALVVAGSTGTLALTGGSGDDAKGVVPAGPVRPSISPGTGPGGLPEEWRTLGPRGTFVSQWTNPDHTTWSVLVDMWPAPKDEAEARKQRTMMTQYGVTPTGARDAPDVADKKWAFVSVVRVGVGHSRDTIDGAQKKDPFSGKDIEAFSLPLDAEAAKEKKKPPQGLVIGKVAQTAKEVTCTWDDGTTVKARRVAHRGTMLPYGVPNLIWRVDGSLPDWFVCVAPEGKGSGSADAVVTKP